MVLVCPLLVAAQNEIGNGDIGIGTTSPETKLHVQTENVGAPSQFAKQIIEGADAHLDLTSSSAAKWGSSLNLIEGTNGSSNTDIWSLVRQTTNGTGNSSFNINFGSANNHTNPSFMTISSIGRIGIGTHSPQSKLHVYNGDVLGTPHSYSDLTVEDDEHGMVTILSPNDKIGYFAFADSDDDFVGGMQYEHHNERMIFRVNNHSSDLMIDQDGDVGIGTTSATARLQVRGDSRKGIRLENLSASSNYLSMWQGTGAAVIDAVGTGKLYVGYDNGAKVVINGQSSGNGIGLVIGQMDLPIGFQLAVNGSAIMEELKIETQTNWPDYVFTPSYDLKPLTEVETYIQENGHLPNIPSAEEVREDGILLGEMNAKLLEKIEELTLYMIDLKKENQELKLRLDKLEAND